WRYTGLGSATAAPPGLVVMAGLTTALFGAGGVGPTPPVVGALPGGGVGAYRPTRGTTGSDRPAPVAAGACAVNPVPRNAIANGRLGPLVVFAFAPLLVALAVRLAQGGAGPTGPVLRGLFALGLLLAFTSAWYPLAPLVLVAAVGAIMLA